MKYLTTDVEHLRHKFANAWHLVISIFIIYLCFIFSSRVPERIMGAFHSTKISGNPGSKSNGTDISRKFVSKISVHLSGLSFFLEIWKFRKFPVPYPVWICPSSFSREKLHDGSEPFNFEPVLDYFLENCGLVVPNFLRFSSLCLHTSRHSDTHRYVTYCH